MPVRLEPEADWVTWTSLGDTPDLAGTTSSHAVSTVAAIHRRSLHKSPHGVLLPHPCISSILEAVELKEVCQAIAFGEAVRVHRAVLQVRYISVEGLPFQSLANPSLGNFKAHNGASQIIPSLCMSCLQCTL